MPSHGEVDIQQVKDLKGLEHFYHVEDAALSHDHVALPADPPEEHLPVVQGEQPSGEHITYHVGYDGTTPVGSLTVTLWTLDNLRAAGLETRIHPSYRRRGFGRAMLGHGVDLVRSAGRTRVFVDSPWLPDGGEGPAFPMLRALGARPVNLGVRRLLDLQAFPVGEPLPAPGGYRVEQWVDVAPDPVVEGLAYLLHRMVLDAPMGELEYEPETWDVARYRDSEASAMRRQRTRVSTVVVHEETGQVAGMTEVAVNARRHDVAWQWNTIVDPGHRGRRLGTVLKSWNHTLLVDQVDGIRYVNTWNAASNSFMIKVNEELGFRPAEQWTEWQLDL